MIKKETLDISNISKRKYNRSVNWSWVWSCIYLRKGAVAGIGLTTIAIYICGLAIPICTQHAIDRTINGFGYESSIWLAGIAIASVFVDIFLGNKRHDMVLSLGTILDRRLSKKLLVHLLRSNVFKKSLNSGDLLNTLQRTNKVRSFVLQIIPQLFFDIGAALVSLVLLFYYDVYIGLIVFTASVAGAAFMQDRIKVFHQAAKTHQEIESRRQSFLSETVNTLYTIKAQAIEIYRFRLGRHHTDMFIESIKTYNTLGRRFGMGSQVFTRVLTLIVICIGTARLAQKQISVGDLLAIQMLTFRISTPFLGIADIFRQFKEIGVAFEKMSELTKDDVERSSSSCSVKKFDGDGIHIKNLSFRYHSRERLALDGINLSLPARGVFAIVGKNGCGKTTLMRILSGLIQDYEGSVIVNGQDIRAYHPRWYRDQLAIVEQDAVLLSGSIETNIVPNGNVFSEAEIWGALEQSDAADFVRSLEGELDHKIMEGGRNLSGGQRQRLAISRALIKKRGIVFLDEPTTFLDPEAGIKLEAQIASLGSKSLVLIVSHHLSSILNADKIIVIDEGKVEAAGTHSELISSSAIYKRLWDDFIRVKPSML